MQFMPIFGGLMSMLGGGKEEKSPAPAPVQERENAPTVEPTAKTAGMKQRASVQDTRKSQTRESGIGISIVGGE